MNSRAAIALLALLIGVLVSWLLMHRPEDPGKQTQTKKPTKQALEFAPGNPSSKRKPIDSSRRLSDFDPRAIPNERIVIFDDEESYRRFLSQLAGVNVRNLGTIDALRAVRLGFDNLADFDNLGLDPDKVDFNYPVTIPETRQLEPQEGIVGFGTNALAFLGITTDNSQWGRGVKIAIIDTGIVPHLALGGNISHINLVQLPDGVAPHSHGTSVASLIAGTHPNMRGVAPAADLISVRVADETGYSTSAVLAEGIIAATDAGAQLINISMGSEGDSLLVRQAVDYARERGTVVFASSGNEGATLASAPARDPDVFAVGAVDANGTHLNFSSADEGLAFTAPGLDIQAALPGDLVTSFTGTSAAVAYPVGAAAAIMSESPTPLSATEAVAIMQTHSNEAGLPGQDAQFGHGILDVGRAINRNTPGITDLAVASQTYLLPTAQDSSSGLQISIENRGTETVYGATVTIDIADDRFPYTIQSIQPNERTVVSIPAGLKTLQSEGALSVSAVVNLPGGTLDANTTNDQRREVIVLPNESGNGP